MRRVLFLVVCLSVLWPALASARVDYRCWLSLGIVGGPAGFINGELTEEFNVPAQFELEVKYYLWKPFSIAGTVGYLYGEGRPHKAEIYDDWVHFDSAGISFWRGYTVGMLARAEIGRYWVFNPYLGGGATAVYNTLERSGKVRGEPFSDDVAEWDWQIPTLIGFDVALNEVLAVRAEGRWTYMPTRSSFTDEKNFDYWSALVGLQIYF